MLIAAAYHIANAADLDRLSGCDEIGPDKIDTGRSH